LLTDIRNAPFDLRRRAEALFALAEQPMRHDDHAAAVADKRAFVFEFFELDGSALARGTDQVRQILMGKFER